MAVRARTAYDAKSAPVRQGADFIPAQSCSGRRRTQMLELHNSGWPSHPLCFP